MNRESSNHLQQAADDGSSSRSQWNEHHRGRPSRGEGCRGNGDDDNNQRWNGQGGNRFGTGGRREGGRLGGGGTRGSGGGYSRGGRGRGGRHPHRQRHDNNRRTSSNSNTNSQETTDDLLNITQYGTPSAQSVTVAVEGCCHGELDRLYERIQRHEASTGQPVDLLLCCGDFQSLRHPADLHSIAVPPKYQALGSFYPYYAGDKRAPILTIFVGGNHESSQALQELCWGGWVAPNIYYLGHAGVVRYKGLRIGGISGIFKSHDYGRGRHEVPPFNANTMRSVYHIRNVDVYRLQCLSVCQRPEQELQKQLSPCLDIFLSHDWPQGIEQHGNTAQLLRRKPFFRQEVNSNTLGSPPNRQLMQVLRPTWWFAAHLHVAFVATYYHHANEDKNRRASHNIAQRKNSGRDDANGQKLSLPPEQGSLASTLDVQQGEYPSNTIKDAFLIPSQVLRARRPGMSNDADTMTTGGQDEETETENTTASSVATAASSPAERAAMTTTLVVPESSTKGCGSGTTETDDLTAQMTRFLALDKCLPRRQYLAIVHVVPSSNNATDAAFAADAANSNPPNEGVLELDAEWLAIIKKTHHLTTATQGWVQVPAIIEPVTDEETAWIRQQWQTKHAKSNNQTVDDNNHHSIQGRLLPEPFQGTVPAYKGSAHSLPNPLPPPWPRMGNPQTDTLLQMLELPHVITIPYDPARMMAAAKASDPVIHGIPRDAEVCGQTNIVIDRSTGQHDVLPSRDDNEIDLSDEDLNGTESKADSELVTTNHLSTNDQDNKEATSNILDSGRKSGEGEIQKKPRLTI